MVDSGGESELISAALHDAQSTLQAREPADQELARANDALKRTAEELRAQTEWLRVTLGSIGDAVVTVDAARRVTLLNLAAEELTGWSAAEAVGQPLDDVMRLLNEATREPIAHVVEAVEPGEGGGSTTANVIILVRKDGEELPIEERSAPILSAEGILIGLVMVFHDVSERRQREIALAQSEERFRLLSTIAPHLLWTSDREGRAEDFNERWFEHTGQSREQALGKGWVDVVHPEDRARMREVWWRSLESGEPFEAEHQLRGADGDYRWFLARAVPFRGPSGEIVRWYGSSTDIHQRRMTAEALREESTLNEQLFDLAKALSAELDIAKVAQIITEAGSRISRAEFGAFFCRASTADGGKWALHAHSGLTDDVASRFPLPDETGMFGSLEVVRVADVRTGSSSRLLADSGLPLVSCLSVPVLSRSGAVLGGLFFGSAEADAFTGRDEHIIQGVAAQAAAAIDTAQAYLAEQQARGLAEAASDAKDRFLAVLSHELRTPLSPVLMTAAALETSPDLAESLREDMAMIRRNVELEARLIDDLLDLSRITNGKLQLNLEPVHVNELVQHVCTSCRPRSLEKGIVLVADLDAQLGWIAADPARLQQVLWNLVNNAVKFTPEGGRVEVTTRQMEDGDVQFGVRDSGRGIEPGVLPQVFDAFEQGTVGVTRQFGGLGLGLAIAKALVELHHGTIEASSDGADRGATFTVVLPPGAPVSKPWLGLNRESSPATEKIRLLVVEDHEDTARTLGILFRRAGFVVHTAHSVAEAVKAVEEHTFDVLVSDWGLPDGTGADVMKRIRTDTPLPAIAMSGYGMEDDLRKSRDAGFAEHLVKPVTVTKLRDAIHRVMTRGIA